MAAQVIIQRTILGTDYEMLFRPIAGNDRIVDPTLFTGILSRDLAGRINWGKTMEGFGRSVAGPDTRNQPNLSLKKARGQPNRVICAGSDRLSPLFP
jgi:hypothetical protein